MIGEDVNNAMYLGHVIVGGGLSSLPVAEAAQQEGRVTVDRDPFISLYPSAEGVSSGGMAAGPTGAVVFKQDDPVKREWAIEFARFLASPELQVEYAVNSNQFPSRFSVPNPFEGNPDFTRVNAWIQEHGVEDMGLSSPTYAEVRVYCSRNCKPRCSAPKRLKRRWPTTKKKRMPSWQEISSYDPRIDGGRRSNRDALPPPTDC